MRTSKALEAAPGVLISRALEMLQENLDRGYGGDEPLKPLDADYARRQKGGDRTPDLKLSGVFRRALHVKRRKGGASIVLHSGQHPGGLSIQGLGQVLARRRPFMRLSTSNRTELMSMAGRHIIVRQGEPIVGRLTLMLRF